jgi:hypothetical protein
MKKNDLMCEKLMKLLKRKWVTPLVALNEAQCLSLAQRVSQWRAEGMQIVDKWVDLDSGKRVKAYRLAA